MKIQVEKLRQTLEILKPVVPSAKHATLPITTVVLFREGGAFATNLDLYAALDLPEATDAVVLPWREGLETLQGIPGHEVVTLETEAGEHPSTRLQAQNRKLAFVSFAPEDFPPVPADMKGLVGHAEVDGDLLLRRMEQVAFYAATEDSRPVLACVCIGLGEKVSVACADGFRLSWAALPVRLPAIEVPPEDMESKPVSTLLVPAKAVAALRHVWARAEKPLGPIARGKSVAELVSFPQMMGLAYNGALLKASFGNATVWVRLTEGTFPNYGQLIPDKLAGTVVVHAGQMRDALKVLGPIASEGSGIIRLKPALEGALTLSARSEEAGESEVEIRAEIRGEPTKIAFSHRYLWDFLHGKDGMVKIETQEMPSQAALFSADGWPPVIQMPMFVDWDKGKKNGEQATSPAPEELAEETVPPCPDKVGTSGAEQPADEGAHTEKGAPEDEAQSPAEAQAPEEPAGGTEQPKPEPAPAQTPQKTRRKKGQRKQPEEQPVG